VIAFWFTRLKKASSVSACPFSFIAYLPDMSPLKYGKFKKLPVSPRSAFRNSCLGNISQSAKPNTDAISVSFFIADLAGTGSL
jgi:hypothetical protein